MGLHASVRVRRGVHLVDVDLDVADGEAVALVGRNGAGKTTVLEALAGLIPLDEGSIELGDRRIDTLDPGRRGVGFAFQDGVLFPRMSARENVAFAARARGERATEARGRADRLLADLAPGVDPAARPAHLSGGEQQRVALARTLASEPQLLLLDEPLAAVDASARPGLRTLLRDTLAVFAGPSILVTHDPVEAMTLADRLVLLEDGRITQVGTPAEVRSHPATRYAADLVGVNLFEGTLEPAGIGTGSLRTGEGELTVAWPEGLERATTLSVRRVAHSWAGLRTSAPDDLPVVGRDPRVPGFCWLAGLGGYGVQLSPAVGRLLASVVLDRDVPADLPAGAAKALSPGRFVRDRDLTTRTL